MTKQNWYRFNYILIVICALCLRLIYLSKFSLWMDEGFSYYFSGFPLKTLLYILAREDNHPPLYYYLLHLWRFLGESELILRLPSVIFGALTVGLAIMVGNLYFSRKVGLLSGVLIATSAFMNLFCREARNYSLAAFLFLLTFYWLKQALDKPGFKFWILYSFTLLLCIYTHYLSFFLILAQGIYLWFYFRNSRSKWTVATGAAIMLALPWLVYYALHWQHYYYEHLPPSYTSLLEVAYSQLYGLTLYLDWHWQWQLLAYCALWLFLWGSWKSRESSIGMIPFTFIFCVLSIFLISHYTANQIWEIKYFYLFAPLFWLTVANGLTQINLKVLRTVLIISILSINLFSIYNFLFIPEWERQNWQEAVKWLKRRQTNQSLIILEPPYIKYVFSYYYANSNSHILPLDQNGVEQFSLPVIKPYRKIFLVGSAPWLSDPQGKLQNLLNNHYIKSEEYHTINLNPGFIIDIYTYEKP